MKNKLIIFVLVFILINIGILFTATSVLANGEPAISSSTDAIPLSPDQPQSDDNTIFLPRDCTNYGTWDEPAKTCKLSQDLTQSVEITTSNTTLDCDGRKIIGTGAGYGVYLNNKDIAIKNCTLSNFYQGIFSYDNTFTISNSTSSGSTYGVYGYSTWQSPFYVLNSNFSHNTYGIYSYSSFASRYGSTYISNSTFSNNTYGIYSANYSGIKTSYSAFIDNDYGIYGYWKLSISTDYSTFSNNTYGIFGKSTWTMETISSVFSGNTYAFYGEGMTGFNSYNSTFLSNQYGMYSYRMYDDGSPRGVVVYSTDFSDNTNAALYINNYSRVETEIYQSVFSGNTLGINIFPISPSAKIYLNNFINNTDNADSHNSPHIWNSPEKITYTYNLNTYTNYLGNYWSDYPGTDTNNDGIGDTPYFIDSANQDNYPLIIPFENYLKPPIPTYNVAVILAEPSDKNFEPEHNKTYFEGIIEQVRDYYCENSFGKWDSAIKTCNGGLFNLNFDIYDNEGLKYKLLQTQEFYGENYRPKLEIDINYDGIIDLIDSDRTEVFAWDAIDLADEDVDYNNYDGIIVVHPDHSEQSRTILGIPIPCPDCLSTQHWGVSFNPPSNPYELAKRWIVVSEKEITGPWAHELGHALGHLLIEEPLCDLYGGKNTCGDVGDWDIMGDGWRLGDPRGSRPSHLSSFSKEMLNWFGEEFISYGQHIIESLETMKLGSKIKKYQLRNDSYYLLEARTNNSQYSQWDTALPEEALVVYKVRLEYRERNGKLELIPVVNKAKTVDTTLPSLPLRDGANNVLIGVIDSIAEPTSFKIKAEINKANLPNYIGIVVRPALTVFKDIFDFRIPQRLARPYFLQDYWQNIYDRIWDYIISSLIFLVFLVFIFLLFRIKNKKLNIGQILGIVLISFVLVAPLSVRIGNSLIDYYRGLTLKGNIEFITDKTVYAPGESIDASLINNYNWPIWYDEYFYGIKTVEKKENEQWKEVGYIMSPPPSGSVDRFLRIDPGGKVTRSYNPNLGPGIYRFKIFYTLDKLHFWEDYEKIFNRINTVTSNEFKVISSNSQPNFLGDILELPADLDLHAYDGQGRHTGMNYKTGEYENQIPGAEVSGDLVYDDEWIFVPEGANVRFLVSSQDIQEMLEAYPELQELTDGIETYEAQAIYYDEVNQRYVSNIVTEQMNPGTALEHPISGTKEITIAPGINPKLLKEASITKLEEAKTGNEKIDREIDKIIKHIENSLEDKKGSLWLDDWHLKPEIRNIKAFREESEAVKTMLNDICECKEKWILPCKKLPPEVEEVFKEVINNLAGADKLLALTIFEDAKVTPVADPKFQKIVDRLIEKAEKEYNEGLEELGKPLCPEFKKYHWKWDYSQGKAIAKFSKTWLFSQLAIKLATKEFKFSKEDFGCLDFDDFDSEEKDLIKEISNKFKW